MDAARVEQHIVDWLRKYLESSGLRGFVVGVSGGIDSAVTSALAARTGYQCICVEMPIHQSQEQITRAAKHIEKLQQQHSNVLVQKVELTSVFDSFVAQLPDVPNSDEREMALVNSRARLRMTTLYYFAALHRSLVAGTGNKVEDFGVGFFTKYGDGGVDLSPIADLNKSQVYELAKHLGIIDDIIQAPPTDGLWGDERTDEDQLGASYPELEWAMEMQEKAYNEDELSERQREVLKIYQRFHRANKHKMEPIPVCVVPTDYTD